MLGNTERNRKRIHRIVSTASVYSDYIYSCKCKFWSSKSVKKRPQLSILKEEICSRESQLGDINYSQYCDSNEYYLVYHAIDISQRTKNYFSAVRQIALAPFDQPELLMVEESMRNRTEDELETYRNNLINDLKECKKNFFSILNDIKKNSYFFPKSNYKLPLSLPCSSGLTLMSYWKDDFRRILKDLIPFGMTVKRNAVNTTIIANALVLREIYKSGTSLRSIDHINKIRYNYGICNTYLSCQAMCNSLSRAIGVTLNDCKMVYCKVCNNISFGNKIFCPHCYKVGLITRRLCGCKVNTCFANNTYWKKHQSDEIDASKFICNHCRTSSENCVICETPLTFITSLVNTKQSELIINSTSEEIRNHLAYCKRTKIVSNMITKNVACCLYAFGEVDLANDIIMYLASKQDPSVIRDSLQAEVRAFSQRDCIERLTYQMTCDLHREAEQLYNSYYEQAISLLKIPLNRTKRTPSLKGKSVRKKAERRISKKIVELSEKRYKASEASRMIAKVYTTGRIPEALKDLRMKTWRKKMSIHHLKGTRAHLAYSLTFLNRLKKRLEAEKRNLGDATVFASNLEYILQSNDPLKRIVNEDTNNELVEFYTKQFDDLIGEYQEDHQDSTISLVHPPDVECEERYIFFRLRFDGVVCSENSLKGNSYDCLSLECINCNEWDRQKNLMTIQGLLLNKGNTPESVERCHQHVQEYLKFVKYTGLNGLYVKEEKWVHYRWAIANVVCDTVAQEELNGLPGKKLSPYPCLFNKECKTQRFCLDSYSFTDLCSPAPISGKSGLHVIGQPLNHLHPNSLYRCTGLVYHLKDNTSQFLRKYSTLTEEQLGELSTLKSFFSQFPDSAFHQWTPNSISPEAGYAHMRRELVEIDDSGMNKEDENCESENDSDSSSDGEVEEGHECQDDHEPGGLFDSFIDNEFVEEERECQDEQDEQLNVDDDENDNDDCDYDLERYRSSTNVSFNVQNRMNDEDNESFVYRYTTSNIDNIEEIVKNAFPYSSSSEQKKILNLLASRDEHMIPNSTIKLGDCIIPREGEREIVDSQHNMANISLMFIRILNNELPSPITKKSIAIVLDHHVRNVIFGNKGESFLTFTLYPDFADIREKAKQRIRQLKTLPTDLNWINEKILETKHFRALSNYRDILFLFSFYHFIFQDSMHHPVIFLFKLIFDHLDIFYNFYGDLDDLAKYQANFDVFCGLLQGELAPGYLTYSLHNALHYHQSIVCGGEVSLNSCFISEHYYSIPKMSVCKGMNPELAAGKRQHFYHTSLIVANIAEPHDVYPSTSKTLSQRYIIYTKNIYDLFKDDFLKAFHLFTKLNICDDIKYEADSSIPHITFLDTVLNKHSYLSESNLFSLVKAYDTNETTGFFDKIHFKNTPMKLFASLHGGKYSVDLPGSIENKPFMYQRLATTRSLDGVQHLFIVVGFISTPLVNDSVYHQALCIRVNTTSSSSFSQTLHSGFIKRNEFERCLTELHIIPISIKRLVFKSVVVYDYNEGFFSYSLKKLVLRQWKAENHNIVEFLRDRIETRKSNNVK